MDDFPKLEQWAPATLHELYLDSFSKKNKPNQIEYSIPLREALFRLGTFHEMKAVWEKLLSSSSFFPDKETLEKWLISKIYLILVDMYVRSENPSKPQFKTKEIVKIKKQINDLILAVLKSTEALGASFSTIKTCLSKEIIKDLPKEIDNNENPSPPIWQWKFISGVSEVFEKVDKNNESKYSEWDAMSQEQKSNFLLCEVSKLNLIEVLKTYLQQLEEVPDIYKSQYINSERSFFTREIYDLLQYTFKNNFSDCVSSMVNAIFKLELGIEGVTSYHPKRKK